MASLQAVLAHPDASVRLRGALAAGVRPAPGQVEVLVRRCAVEPAFEVRDMLTWALTRHDRQQVVDRLLLELGSTVPRARSQALHTLSKLGDRRAWPAITVAHLQDPDAEVARTAWRAAVALVPDAEAAGLAEVLAGQLGRGDRPTRRSLSRALVALGHPGAEAVHRATTHPDPAVRAHTVATERLLRDPDEGSDVAVEEAARVVALRGAPLVEQVREC